MFFLNLSMAEFAALFSVLGGVVVALYLLDRSRKKIKVATLRFWVPADKPPEAKQRRKIQQPLSLLLQMLGLLLLLAALGQLRWGSPEHSLRDHVLLLDTSAWMKAKDGRRTLLDSTKADAITYLRSLPSADRVMVVSADALATPATVFESNRSVLEEAIKSAKAGSSALQLTQAIDFAKQMQRLHGRGEGEIVYTGAGRMADKDENLNLPKNFRLLSIRKGGENVGLRKVSLRRSAVDGELWEVFVTAHNFGIKPRVIPIALAYGHAPVASGRLELAPGADQSGRYEFRTKARGELEIRLIVDDAIAADNRAIFELPAQRLLDVAVYSDEPELLRPFLGVHPWIIPKFFPTRAYSPDTKAAIVILDRFKPAAAPKGQAIYIEPPSGSSPAGTASPITAAMRLSWRNEHPVGEGLRTGDVRLERGEYFPGAVGSTVIAEADGKPVIVALTEPNRAVMLGFHPAKSQLRYELAAPLLFANILNWLAPEVARQKEWNGESIGMVRVAVDSNLKPENIQVLNEGGVALPFTLAGNKLQFFAGAEGMVRVITGGREQVYSLTLPEVAEKQWEPPKTVRRGLPGRFSGGASSFDLWQWLAMAGGLCLLFDWLWFGRIRLHASTAGQQSISSWFMGQMSSWRKAG